jgi:hypothetical protein
MKRKVAIAFIVACFAVAIANQGFIRYSWLQSTEGCAANLIDWIEAYHRTRVVSMGALLAQVLYAWGLYSYLTATRTLKLVHVGMSLLNLVLMSCQMGTKSLVKESWGTCAEAFEEAYGYIDYCQATAIFCFGIATMVGHAMGKTKEIVGRPPPYVAAVPTAPPASTVMGQPRYRKASPLTWRGVIISHQ